MDERSIDPDTQVVRPIAAMNAGSFDIVPHFDRHHLVITLRGLWDGATVRRYHTALHLSTMQMTLRGSYRGALVDASDFAIQPAAIAAEHGTAMTIARSIFAARAAVVMNGSRSRLQMARIVAQTGHRLFARSDDAMEWLCA